MNNIEFTLYLALFGILFFLFIFLERWFKVWANHFIVKQKIRKFVWTLRR